MGVEHGKGVVITLINMSKNKKKTKNRILYLMKIIDSFLNYDWFSFSLQESLN